MATSAASTSVVRCPSSVVSCQLPLSVVPLLSNGQLTTDYGQLAHLSSDTLQCQGKLVADDSGVGGKHGVFRPRLPVDEQLAAGADAQAILVAIEDDRLLQIRHRHMGAGLR